MILAPPAQTEQQPEASPGAGEMPVDPILESPSARQHARESIAAPGALGGSDRLSTTTNESAIAPSATAESGAENPAVLREPMALPDASEGMVGAAIRTPSPQVVPPATTEENEVEDIIRDEPRPQSVLNLQKRGDDIVIVEEEDTTKEFRRLDTALTGVTKHIKVSTASGKVLVDVWNWITILSLCICRK